LRTRITPARTITTITDRPRAVAGKKPKILITDGLKSYEEACNFEYWTPKIDTRTTHIRHITLTGEHHNNKMERMNGEVRDREKVMRGLKRPDTPILKGYQIYHNYVRPHEGLEGKTPAEAAGIQVEGENKWLTLIENAATTSAKYDERRKNLGDKNCLE